MWTFGAKYHFYFITINQLTVLPEKIRVPKLHNSLKIKNFLKKYNTDKNKKVYDKVYIRFDSFALGDTLAWIPYVEEFRKKHNCEVVCTTFWNNLFKEQYLDIEFEEPGSEFIISSEVPEYEIGWFYDGARNPNDVRTISLQQTASDILGLEYEEIRPKLKLGYERPIEEKYVCISVQSTAQCKYWNWPNGWQEVVDYLNEMGYKVVCIDKDKVYGNEGYWNTVPNGVVDDTGDKPLERRVQYLEHCEFFIGIGAGLSWLAWACKAKVILISSFSKPFCEFQFDCIRIYNDNEKSGYFNNKDFILDSGDWNWNPLKEIKSMEDWYDMESITPQMVKEAINMQIPPQIPFYNIEEQRYWNWDVWEQDGHEWSEQFGGTDKLWEEYIGSDIEKYLSGNVLEIACGHGRMTEKLLQNEIEYTGIDLNQNCVDRCKEIFVDYSNVNFIVNDGISLNMIGDKSIDLVFSWDSFVHMHKNVVESYFSEISRVIKDDGKILIHHANFSGGYDLSFKNWHGRANLTHQEFLTICKKYSIKIINQRPIVMKTENSSVTDMISLCGK
jgi:autotransporter strand-loop-strand O-heptosyltransferase